MTIVDKYSIQGNGAVIALTPVTSNGADLYSGDVSQYRSGSVYLTGFGTATVQIQISNDNTNWFQIPMRSALGTGTITATSANQYLFTIPPTKYLRIRTTTWAAGTITGTLFLSTLPYSDTTNQLTSNNGLTVASGGVLNADNYNIPNALFVNAFNGYYSGLNWDRQRNPNVFKDLNAVAVGAIATVWTPAAGKKFRLMGGVISASAAANVLFEDNAAAAFVFRTPKLLVDTPFAFTLGGNGFLSAAANNVLKATSSAAANITGTLYGTEE